MIEVIGLPPAIEAADAALKASNVTLLAIAKADAGILTVEITGDVSAVTAAVEAGAAAANRVGTLRAKHIIPRVDESLEGRVIMQGTKLFQPKKKVTGQVLLEENDKTKDRLVEDEITEGYDTYEEKIHSDKNEKYREESKEGIYGTSNNKEIEKSKEVIGNIEDSSFDEQEDRKEEIEKESKEPPIEVYTATELKKKSNETLRGILQSRGVELTDQHRSAKKQELIQLILTMQNLR